MENIWDIIESDRADKYSGAKERLLNIFRESENTRIKRLFTTLELGDQMPSQFLRRMKTLAGEDVTEKVLKTLWIEKMPAFVKNILLISEENLEKLAEMADKIVEINPRSEEYVIESQSETETMAQKIRELEREIHALKMKRSRSPSRGRRNSRDHRYRKFDPQGKYCYYHFKFGEKCQKEKCKPPCQWAENIRQQQT